MFVENLHVIVEDSLFAIEWNNKKTHCLNVMSEVLSNAVYLEAFFDKRQKGSKYENIGKELAILKTQIEVREILQVLNELAESDNLNEIFDPLHKEKFFDKHHRYYTDFQTKGVDAPWIRLYAVKIDKNVFVLTGFGIKLVAKIQDDPLLEKELEKLEIATNYLKDKDIL